jgi:ATP/maltotriose-dependent transcriptional regulator MalT
LLFGFRGNDESDPIAAPARFVLSGVPEHTFVQPVEYTRLLVNTPGRSIVVEGPSGIGKTTAVMKAIAEAGLADRVLSLSARKRDDVAFIQELPKQLPLGTVLIDDFHRLADDSKREANEDACR